MSAEAWALVGVTIGAILGGLAQVLADALRSRRERAGVLRSSRQAAYAEVLASWEECFHRELIYRTQVSKVSGNHDLPEVVWEPLMAALRRLTQSVAQVEILGPRDTANEAHDMERAMLDAAIVHDGEERTEVETGPRKRFISLAKRDLGITESGYPSHLVEPHHNAASPPSSGWC